MDRKIATAELAGFFTREIENHPRMTLAEAHQLLRAEADQESEPSRERRLLDEATELIRDHGPDTPVADFLPNDRPTQGSPGTHG